MAVLPPPPRRVRRHRGLFWTGLLACAVLIVAGAAYAYSGYRSARGADGAVRGYLNALARGDAPAALSYGQLPSGTQTFLTTPVLRKQLALAPIRDISVGDDVPSGDGTRVSFSYSLGFARGAQRVSDTVVTHKIGGRWTLDRVAANVNLTMSQARDRATLAGAAFPSDTVLLFPGAVPVQYDTTFLRLTLDTDQVQLSSTGDVALSTELTPAARAVLARALESDLSACSHPGDAGWARCPLPDGQVVPGSLSGTMTAPASSLDLSVDDSSSGTISITGDATFTGTYKMLDFNDLPRTHHGTVPVPIRATAFAVPPLAISFEVES